MKLGNAESAWWSVGAGAAIAVLARSLRSLVRRDMNSSFTDADFILEEAEITIPVEPGRMGKATVRRFGSQVEVYVRASTPERGFERGDAVRIVDFREDYYVVEASEGEAPTT